MAPRSMLNNSVTIAFSGYLRPMTDQEILAYFENRTLPDSLRIDRATTQYEVSAAVVRNSALLAANPKNDGARHRLQQIQQALETPYTGPEIPRF
jgi:hypothetical protein